MMKYFLSLIGLFNCYAVLAQNDSMRLNGSLSVQKGSTYKYDLVITLVHDKWIGYSVLDKNGPNETRSSVVVQFMGGKSAMMFTEKELISSKASSSDFCFVGGMLRLDEAKSKVKGIFFGRDKQKKICGTGSVQFQAPERAKQLMLIPAAADSSSNNNKGMVLTRFHEERFRAGNATVALQLWDGGIQDNDSLIILLNDQVIQDRFAILKEKKIVTLHLAKGKNVLKIKALNEGSEPPNSARIMVQDGDKQYSLVSFLKKGEEAKLTIEF